MVSSKGAIQSMKSFCLFQHTVLFKTWVLLKKNTCCEICGMTGQYFSFYDESDLLTGLC